MDIVGYFDTVFWETATALVGLIIPLIALFAVFRLVHDLLWR